MIPTDECTRNARAAASTTGGKDTGATTTALELSLLDTWIDQQNDDDDNSNIDKDPHLALTVHLKKTRLEELTSRKAYESRLRTFRPLTYFCKPTSLSPIVCARFGWINTSLDMLQCVSCKAALCVTIHPKIQQPSTLRKLVEAYQTKLATAHKEACPFRFDAEILLISSKESSAAASTETTNNDEDADSNDSDLSDDDIDDDNEDKHKHCRQQQKQNEQLENVVPLHLASILPRDVWTLIESPTPLPLLQTRFNRLSETIIHQSSSVDGAPPKWQFPTIELPQDVLLFRCHDSKKKSLHDNDNGNNEGDSVASRHNQRHSPTRKSRMLARLAFDPSQPYTALGWEQETLLTKFEKLLHPPTNEQDIIRVQTRSQGAWEDLYEGVAALALFGWIPTTAAVTKEAEDPADTENPSSGCKEDYSAISLHCPICLASLKFKMIMYDPHHRDHNNEVEENDASPARKRRRLGNDGGDQETAVKSSSSVNPLHAHRYHCPYVCGFPRNGERKATPIWKTIASKVLTQASLPSERTTEANTNDRSDAALVAEEEDCEAKTNRILLLLQSGISTYVSRQSKTNESAFL